MGLDMYLSKYKKFDDTTPEEISALDGYFSWKTEVSRPDSKYKNTTMEHWCGYDESDITSEQIEFYREHYIPRFSDWDTEHKYPMYTISEDVGVWRKANQIHNWFVTHLADGIDNCEPVLVSKSDLEDLRDDCMTIVNQAVMTPAYVHVGTEYTSDGMREMYEDGLLVLNSEICEDVLPTSDGFFFGSTDYDNYYMDDVVKTIKIIDKVLAETDFDTEQLYYVASW